MIIGLTGMNGSGKTEVADYLKKKGFSYFSLSDVIREKLKEEKKELSRENMIEKGNELREKFGPSVLAEGIAKKIKGNAVVDSIRNPEEIKRLSREKDFTLLGIEAPIKIRYKRALVRKRIGEEITFEKFKELEEREKTGDENAQQLGTCMKMADFVIINEGTIDELHKKIDDLIELQ